MRLVDRAVMRPNHCAVYPQLGQAHEQGYFDTGNDMGLRDDHVYVSVVAVKEMAKHPALGMVDAEEHAITEARLEAAMERIETLEAELAERQQVIDSIDFIGSHDFIARKKRGPKPQAERSAA